MSRIGKAPVAIPSGVTVTVGKDNVVTVKGPKFRLKMLGQEVFTNGKELYNYTKETNECQVFEI